MTKSDRVKLEGYVLASMKNKRSTRRILVVNLKAGHGRIILKCTE
jgi:hypothetical protein